MNDIIVTLVAEQLEVGTRTVETGGVQVAKRVLETEQAVELPLRREEVSIERVSINRAVAQAEPIRQEGDVTIVPVYEEVVVVTRQLMLKEELRLSRRSTIEVRTQHHTLRREEIEITRVRNQPD